MEYLFIRDFFLPCHASNIKRLKSNIPRPKIPRPLSNKKSPQLPEGISKLSKTSLTSNVSRLLSFSVIQLGLPDYIGINFSPSYLLTNKNRNKTFSYCDLFSSDPAGTRTQDPYIKSVLLYQLSYEIVLRNLRVQR